MLAKIENIFLTILRVATILAELCLLIGVIFFGARSLSAIKSEPTPITKISQVSYSELAHKKTPPKATADQSPTPVTNKKTTKASYEKAARAITKYVTTVGGTPNNQVIDQELKNMGNLYTDPEIKAAFVNNLGTYLEAALNDPNVLKKATSPDGEPGTKNP